jgi:hypothetical protein
MIGYGIIEDAQDGVFGDKDRNSFDNITTGIVVDTNDPQQMGRVRVLCPTLGDNEDKETIDIPWALYMSPFGGTHDQLSRGPNDDTSGGGVTYGMWNIPKVGAQVLVACIDGNPFIRVWLGCIYGQFAPHTMPHGRFMVQDGDVPGDNKPEGPLANDESSIDPLYSNLKKAFGEGEGNHEWRTRGADYSVAAIDKQIVEALQVYANIADDKDNHYDGVSYRQGYALNRTDPDETSTLTDKVYDSQVYSWTTPGFHAISMDDRPENGRMRFRTSTGHQIILDDTNERIYIATAEGNNWIELDKSGNIDIHSERRISIHANKDINFTTDETFRVHAKKGIHMYSDGETRIHAKKDIHVRSDLNLRTHSAQETFIESGQNMNLKSSAEFRATSSATLNLNAGGDMMLTASPNIHLNGPSATQATVASEKQAYWTNRVPQHEPYGRIMMTNTDNDSGNSHTLELNYDDSLVGKQELDDLLSRGPHWRR